VKITHRIPMQVTMRNDPISDDYWREVERSTRRLEVAFHKAEKRLRDAEHKAERLVSKHAPKKDIATAWAVVELRRTELDNYARMMATAPQPAANRGRKSFRPVPTN